MPLFISQPHEIQLALLGESMGSDGQIETGNQSSAKVDRGRLRFPKETAGRTLREVMRSDLTVITDPVSKKKFVTRCMALVSLSWKLGAVKMPKKICEAINAKHPPSLKISADCTSECNNLRCSLHDETEAPTLGDLLTEAGGSFPNQCKSREGSRRDTLAQIIRLSARVLCGSSTGVVKDDDLPAVVSEISEGETSSSQILANYVVHEVLSMIQEARPEPNVVDSSLVSGVTGRCIERNREIFHGTPSIGGPDISWPVLDCAQEQRSSRGQSISPFPQGNIRLSTLVAAESPMLTQNHGTRQDVQAMELLESSPVMGPEETETNFATIETPNRVSLISLLQETEEANTITKYPIANGGVEHESEDESRRIEGEGIDPMCCVCMVNRKGSAFIPCGHSFCRTCSRELWKIRQACPLCNKAILQILDLY